MICAALMLMMKREFNVGGVQEREKASLSSRPLSSLSLSHSRGSHPLTMYACIHKKQTLKWKIEAKTNQRSFWKDSRGYFSFAPANNMHRTYQGGKRRSKKLYGRGVSCCWQARIRRPKHWRSHEMPLAHKKANFIHEFKPYWKIIGNFATHTKSCTVCKSFWLICFLCSIFSQAFCYNKLRLIGMCHDKWGMTCMDLTHLTKSPLHPSI